MIKKVICLLFLSIAMTQIQAQNNDKIIDFGNLQKCNSMVKYNHVKIDDCNVFYREAGDSTRPTILLLHGFPSASHQFRELIPELADNYHLIAPDLPGFGQTIAPGRDQFAYTFEHLTDIIDHFTEALGIHQFAMYVFDYGAPVGFRIAVRHPERILAIISQNGNIYQEGLGKKWEARAEYWAHPTAQLREQYKSAFAQTTIIGQYTGGTEPGLVGPDGYTLDYAYMCRPGMDEIQSDLIFDYQSNVKLYPVFQQYLRSHRPALLAVWGKNDPSFVPAGAMAFARDLPDAEIHLVNSGHFALETHHTEIALLMKDFLKRHGIQ